MNNITYNVNSGKILNIGRQFDHKVTHITFEGFSPMRDGRIMLRVDGLGIFLLLEEMALTVTQGFTMKRGKITWQLVEIADDGELVQDGPLFDVRIDPSLEENVEMVEEPFEVKSWQLDLENMIKMIQKKLDDGDFKGEPFHYEDFTPEQLEALKGKDGYSPTAYVSKDGKTTTLTMVDKSGTTHTQVYDGEDGYTPIKGVDYFTDSEISEFKSEVTPKKGIDYRDGVDGKDYLITEADYDAIAGRVDDRIDAKRTEALNAVDTAKTNATNAVNTSKSEAETAISNKTEEQLARIPEVTEIKGEVVSLNEDLAKISEGIKKSTAVKITGAYIASATGVITLSTGGAETAYWKCEPNSRYIIKKLSSKVFRIGTSNSIPSVGMTLDNYINCGEDSEYTFTTGENSEYIVINYYITSTQATPDADTMFESIQFVMSAKDNVARGVIAEVHADINSLKNNEPSNIEGTIFENTISTSTPRVVQPYNGTSVIMFELDDDVEYEFTSSYPSNVVIGFSNTLYSGTALTTQNNLTIVDGKLIYKNTNRYKYAYILYKYTSGITYEVNCKTLSELQKRIKDNSNEIEALKELTISSSITEAEITKINGKFVNALTKVLSSNSWYFYTELYPLNRGDSVIVTSKDPSGSAVGRISKWSADGNTLESIIDVGTTAETTATYTAVEETEYIRFSGYKTNSFVVKRSTIEIPNDFEIAVKKVVGEDEPTKESPYTLSMFENVAVCGDSYTAGSVNRRDGTVGTLIVLGYAPYGEMLERITGCDVTTYASGGADTLNYQTRSDCLPKLLSEPAKDIYVFALGINDYSNSSTRPLGTIADIKDDYTQNANTFYGNYGKIIAQVMAHAPKAKIVISTVFIPTFANGVYYKWSENAVKEIAEHFGVMSIDTAENEYLCSSVYNSIVNSNGGHPTAPAYSAIAKCVNELVDKCIENNEAYFNDYIPHPVS